MKEFNTNAVCIPSKHYMVDLTSRVAQIRKMVNAGRYFTINRARQYGKTTMLNALRVSLSDQYEVISLDFQGIGSSGFSSEQSFIQSLCRLLRREKRAGLTIPENIDREITRFIERTGNQAAFDEFFDVILDWCSKADKPLVLMIDEVDSAVNNQVFLDFLALLRDGYISRDTKGAPAFQSVILAGVTDIRYLKGKIRDEDRHKVNSPWNIAADFLVDMSFNTRDIKGMLDEYETDHNTGMDTGKIAQYIEEYTNGYPFLVSRICQLIDKQMVPAVFTDLSSAWTEYGVDEAVKKILSEDNALFDSMTGKLVNYPELKRQLKDILLKGITVAYLPDDEPQKQLRMYGFIENRHNVIAVANRIFEMRLYHHFIGQSNHDDDLKQAAAASRSIFTCDGCLTEEGFRRQQSLICVPG